MTAAGPAYTTLIKVDEWRALSPAEDIVVIDTSFDLADAQAGERSWQSGHVPGSIYLHLDRDLCGPTSGHNGRHPLPDRTAFAETLGRAGITAATQVVVLDRQGAMFAARLWWMLRWMGHAAVAVLDGGVTAWTASGGILVTDCTAPMARAPYPAAAPLTSVIDADTLGRRLGRVALVDARAAERFRGEVEPLDARAGHIPGARQRFFKDNLDASGRFKPPAELHAAFAVLLGARRPDELVHQCGSGVTACHNLLAMEHAGLAGSVLYPGSWSEWSADPARPVARG